MAILTVDQLARIRQEFARDIAIITRDKLVINASLQAIENWFEDNRLSLSTAIEAVAPGAFTPAEKKMLVKHWLFSKFGRE